MGCNSAGGCVYYPAMKRNSILPDDIFLAERISNDIVRIQPLENKDANTGVHALRDLVGRLFEEGITHIVFDMEHVDYPNASFIAELISGSLEARLRGGDIKIIHLSDTARNHMTLFTPLTYLAIGDEEIFNIRDFDDVYPTYLEKFVDFKKDKPESLYVDAIVENLNRLTSFVSTMASKTGLESIEVSKLKIAVYEAAMNVVEHGYKFESGRKLGVEVLWTKKRLQITMLDKGEKFNFYDLKPYNVREAFEEKRQGGFGLYIIRRSVDEIRYEAAKDPGGWNRLVLVKKI